MVVNVKSNKEYNMGFIPKNMPIEIANIKIVTLKQLHTQNWKDIIFSNIIKDTNAVC